MKIKSIITILLAVMLLVCGCAQKENDSAVIKTEHCRVDDAMLEFIFYYNYYELYSAEADYYGLSTDLTFSEQMYSQGVSWQQHLSELAMSDAKKYVLLKEAAIDLGFEYEPALDAKIAEYTDNASAMGMTADEYYKAYFGEKVTEETLREFFELQLYALAYESYLKEEYTESLTDADYSKYYDEHKAEIEIVDALTYSIPINYYGVINSEKRDSLLACKTPEEFKAWIANDLTEKNEASDTPKTAEELAVKIAEKTEVVRSYYTPGGDFSEWAFAEDTELYDTHYAEKNTGMYDIYMLVKKPYAWEKYNHNVGRIVLSGKDYASIEEVKSKADEIIAQLDANGGGADAFEALYKEYNGEGECFYYNVQDDFYGDESSRVWLKDEARKEGDVTALATPDGYSIIYYAGRGMQRWMADAKDNLANAYIENCITEFEAKYADSMTVNENAIEALPEALPGVVYDLY
ncbi:MAG: hypothetical protein IKT46_06035 [Clostridia bacterium]|nr:hypothetical protein [Clostridia bacterium]